MFGARQAESIGWLPAPFRPASCSRGSGVLERTTHCCVAPTQGIGEEHYFEGGESVVDKPLRGGDWTGVLSSNDACGLSHSHPKWWPDSAWPGREEIHIETTVIREYLSMLASGGGLSFLW